MPGSPEERKAVGLQIKLTRITKGWNQSELAERCDVTQASISRLESGNSTNPGLLPNVLRVLRNSEEENLLSDNPPV